MGKDHSRLLVDLTDLSAVARFIGIRPKQLGYLLRGRRELDRYREFEIPKRRGGVRKLMAPREDLKAIQRSLAQKLDKVYRRRTTVHGFLRRRSIVTNANRHVRRRYVFNLDLQDFFPTINFGRVRGLFLKLGTPEAGATVLAQLCCHEGALPQGAPTSPVVSNMVCARLDRQLGELARDHQCVYTRYADDITFSRMRTAFPREIGYLDDEGNAFAGEPLLGIIDDNGFSVNEGKVWLFNNKHRQSVTGLTVNAKCNVPRTFVRQVRAMIHAWAKYGEKAADAVHAESYYHRQGRLGGVPPFRLVIRGKLEFIKMVKGVEDPVYRNLQTQFVRVCPEYLEVMLKENEAMAQRDVFISHASENKDEIARPLTEALVAAGFTVWFDEYEIRIGDSLRAKIDDGLAFSRFGIVILSKEFFVKRWPRRELDGLTACEDTEGRNRILPVWHGVDHPEVAKFSPTLAGLKALVADGKSPSEMVAELAAVLK